MTDNVARQRQGKKRCIARILDAMHRLDAIYPEIKQNTPVFSSLILFCWLIMADGQIHPSETRLLSRLVSPYIKLRRDDVEYVCSQIENLGMTDKHAQWLVSFIQSGMTPDDKVALSVSLEQLAMADHRLHPAELAIVRNAQKMLGINRSSGIETA